VFSFEVGDRSSSPRLRAIRYITWSHPPSPVFFPHGSFSLTLSSSLVLPIFCSKMAHSKTSSESLQSTPSPIENPRVVPNEQAAPSNEVVVNNEKDVEAAAPRAPPPNFLGTVPNGGLQAWLQVVAGFALFFNTWGKQNHITIFYHIRKLIPASRNSQHC
jgi:hypothetical protein